MTMTMTITDLLYYAANQLDAHNLSDRDPIPDLVRAAALRLDQLVGDWREQDVSDITTVHILNHLVSPKTSEAYKWPRAVEWLQRYGVIPEA